MIDYYKCDKQHLKFHAISWTQWFAGLNQILQNKLIKWQKNIFIWFESPQNDLAKYNCAVIYSAVLNQIVNNFKELIKRSINLPLSTPSV